MQKACWLFVVGVLACGAASRMDRHLEAAGPSPQTTGARTLDRLLGRQDGGRRLALVVGNDAYPDSPLRNAVNDARAVAAALAEVGFAVTRVENASRARMAGAIGDFAADLSEDDTALFYFAGHGVQVGESPENYLIPTDFDGRTESAVRLNALKAADVVGELQRARVAMAVFDACRNNPYRGRRGPTGLAAMEARGTLIAYAADAGQTASDNPAGQNGLFTQHFVSALREPGLTATALFQQVRRGVVAASRERQWPAVYDSLLADFVFRARIVTDPDPVVTATELEYWRSVQAMNTAEAYRSYERQYPNGRFAELSRLRRSELGDVASGGSAMGAGDLSSRRRPGGVFRDCPSCPEMVVIPAGTFMMGSPASEEGRDDDEGPRHRVTLESFALGRYEVTRGEYAAFASATGRSPRGCKRVYDGEGTYDASWWRNPGFAQGDGHPVVCVSWDDAQAYVRWLSRETGEEYRLPSESEWEYAARGGATTSRYWGNGSSPQCGYANGADAAATLVYTIWGRAASCDDGALHTASVGSYAANAFGLFDALGNVWEWTADCWHDTYAGAPGDGSAWTRGGDCGRRVLRGGSWLSAPRVVRSAARGRNTTGARSSRVGFRVSRTLD